MRFLLASSNPTNQQCNPFPAIGPVTPATCTVEPPSAPLLPLTAWCQPQRLPFPPAAQHCAYSLPRLRPSGLIGQPSQGPSPSFSCSQSRHQAAAHVYSSLCHLQCAGNPSCSRAQQATITSQAASLNPPPLPPPSPRCSAWQCRSAPHRSSPCSMNGREHRGPLSSWATILSSRLRVRAMPAAQGGAHAVPCAAASSSRACSARTPAGTPAGMPPPPRHAPPAGEELEGQLLTVLPIAWFWPAECKPQLPAESQLAS